MKNLYNLRLTILYFILISFIVSQSDNNSTSASTNSTEVTNTTNTTNTTDTTNNTNTNTANITNTTNNANNITFPDLNISNSTARIVPNYLCSPTGKLTIV